MAIFKRGDRIPASVPNMAGPAASDDNAAIADDVASAEAKVKSLLGQHEEAATTSNSSSAATVFHPSDAPSDTDSQPAAASAPEPSEPSPPSTLPEPEPKEEHSVLDNNGNDSTDAKKNDETSDEAKPASTIAVKDDGDAVIEDVDEKVQEMIGKLSSEGEHLNEQISTKNQEIQKLQSEIDTHNARKAEIDKKVAALKQVVDSP